MKDTEIDLIVTAAHILNLDSPIIHYRIVGSRIELWTIHGGPYVYDPDKPSAVSNQPSVKKKPPIKKPTSSNKKK